MIRVCGLILAVSLLVTGCTSKTDFGQCIGAFDQGRPELEYKPSWWNVGLAIVFVETIIVPIAVLLNSTKCPTGNAPPAKKAEG